jgi:hypothetical protein
MPVYTVYASLYGMASIVVGQAFSSLAEAKGATKLSISEQHESYVVDYSDKTRFRVICPIRSQTTCSFQIRATDSKRHGVTITHMVSHTCSPTTHFNAKNIHSVEFIAPHHKAAVIDNPIISVKQIQSNERLQHNNTINYQQAYRKHLYFERFGAMNQSVCSVSRLYSPIWVC